jgi:outer membrane protein assembly factor BamC
MNMTTPKLSLIATACVASLLALQGCSSTSDSGDAKINYRSETTAKTKSLDIPPDLTQLTAKDPRYTIPGASVSANAYRANSQVSSVTTTSAPVANTAATSAAAMPAATNTGAVAPRQMGDVRLVRDRDERWLHVDRNIEQVWPAVHEFWLTNGFVYIDDQPQIGILETDWAENRAKIPMDFIRRTIGKVFDNAYSSGERDKFKIRIERSDAGGVDIFVTHRGMSEEYTDQTKSRTAWMPRPRDPALEAEFMSRLMLQLGGSKEAAQQVATNPTQAAMPVTVATTAELVSADDLLVKDSFDIAWRRVGVALDRNGFTVEDRDRNQGIYFVRYVKSNTQEEPGFFSRMFSSSKATDIEPQKYRVVLKTEAGVTHVTIQNSQGQKDTGDIANNILKLMSQSL